MNDLQSFWQRLHQNLNILREREARYGGNAPLELLNQIEDHEKAIFLTRQRLDSLISEADWREALKPLLLAVEPEPDGISSEQPARGVIIGQVSGGIQSSTIAGRDINQTTYNISDSSDDDVVIIIQGDVNMGDSIKSSDDIRATLLNLISNLSQVSQNVQAIPGGTSDQKGELQRLLRQLGEALQQTPPDQIEAAEAIVQAADQLVNTATRKKPNKTLVKITGKGLTEAAQTLAETMPPVMTLAAQIVEIVRKFIR